MDPPSVAKEALKLRIEREYAKLADLAAGETRAMYVELAHQADVAWHEQTGSYTPGLFVEMMYCDDEKSGAVYTACCREEGGRWWFAGTRTRERAPFLAALDAVRRDLAALPSAQGPAQRRTPLSSPPMGVFPLPSSASRGSLAAMAARQGSGGELSSLGGSEDPYFDLYPALMTAEEEQAAMARKQADQHLRTALQGVRRLALALGLADLDVAAAACEECGVDPADVAARAGDGLAAPTSAAAAAAAAPAARMSHGVAPDEAERAINVAKLQKALAEALPGAMQAPPSSVPK